MLDTPCSKVVWRVLATHSICQFPLHFPSHASPCAITFYLESTNTISAATDSIQLCEVKELRISCDIKIYEWVTSYYWYTTKSVLIFSTSSTQTQFYLCLLPDQIFCWPERESLHNAGWCESSSMNWTGGTMKRWSCCWWVLSDWNCHKWKLLAGHCFGFLCV